MRQARVECQLCALLIYDANGVCAQKALEEGLCVFYFNDGFKWNCEDAIGGKACVQVEIQVGYGEDVQL